MSRIISIVLHVLIIKHEHEGFYFAGSSGSQTMSIAMVSFAKGFLY